MIEFQSLKYAKYPCTDSCISPDSNGTLFVHMTSVWVLTNTLPMVEKLELIIGSSLIEFDVKISGRQIWTSDEDK